MIKNANLIVDDFGDCILAARWDDVAEFLTNVTHARADSESDWENRFYGRIGYSEMSNDALNYELEDFFDYAGDEESGHPDLHDPDVASFIHPSVINKVSEREPVAVTTYGYGDENRERRLAAWEAYEAVYRGES